MPEPSILRREQIQDASSLGEDVLRPEFLVIGSGAGGSVAAARLAEAGAKVLVLEEGGAYLTPDLSGKVSELTQKLYRNGGAFPIFGGPVIPFGEGRCLGGGTVINGGLVWRTPEWVLEDWRKEGGLGLLTDARMAELHELVEQDLSVRLTATEPGSNVASQVIEEAARRMAWKTVAVPRALKACRNLNLCAVGCPSGAKQSTLMNYLGRAAAAGAQLVTGASVESLRHSGGRIGEVLVSSARGRRKLRVLPQKVIVAAGATQSPALLARARLHPQAGARFEFHINLKIVARFARRIDARNGTIFTAQVQEFERERMLFMASNFQPSYLALSLESQDPRRFSEAMHAQEEFGIYVAMVRPFGHGRLRAAAGGISFAHWAPTAEDRGLFQAALLRLSKLLFVAGAVELFLPIKGSAPCRSPAEVESAVENLQMKHVEAVSVHGMSGCRMGSDSGSSVTDPYGKVWGMENLWVLDSAILPSNTGESPQGTIMALAHHGVERILS
jgi:choline dehydrogenase-like flavoprotein